MRGPKDERVQVFALNRRIAALPPFFCGLGIAAQSAIATGTASL
jgi:hypothetical protein